MSTGQGAVLARLQFLHMPNSSGGGHGCQGELELDISLLPWGDDTALIFQ